MYRYMYILKCSHLHFSRLKIHQIKFFSKPVLALYTCIQHLNNMGKKYFQINLTTNELYVLREKKHPTLFFNIC